ncbi:MAG: helix-turn-helix domain-containing protein [Rhizobiales bacterium]|nr:helix-turn-helix domain-containing protein [Hyphomicrobiales bacterium]
MDSSFGALLRTWRDRRHMSQLDLGLTANVSARHISFLETGRARPSRTMVLMLGEVLEVPRTSRNALLHAAGFAPAYRSRKWSDDDMAPVRDAVDWTLARHDPYPAFALDRHWVLVNANRSATALLGGLGLDLGRSLVDLFTDVDLTRALFVNWHEVMHHMLARLRTESLHLGGDEILDRAADKVGAALGGSSSVPAGTLAAVIPARYRANGMTLSFLSTIAQFGTAEDIALADLKIEMLFPADEATRQMLVTMFDSGAAATDGARA